MDKRVEAGARALARLRCDRNARLDHTPRGEAFLAGAVEHAWPYWVEESTAALAAADAVSAAAPVVPEGFRVVPIEPTDAMCAAGYNPPISSGSRLDNQREMARGKAAPVYAAMLSAAPPAPLRIEEEIRKDERERCAKIAETPDEDDDAIDRQVRRNVAAAIRQVP